MSRSLVVRRLRSVAAQGIPASARHLLPNHAGLVAEVLAVFGSFPHARDAAKLDGPPTPQSADEVVTGLQVLHAAGTRIDMQTLMRLGDAALVTGANRLFGSLAAAADAAGIPPSPGQMSLRFGGEPKSESPELTAVFARIDRAAAAAGEELKAALETLMAGFVGAALEQVRDATAEVAFDETALPRAAAERDATAAALTDAIEQLTQQAIAQARAAVLAQAREALAAPMTVREPVRRRVAAPAPIEDVHDEGDHDEDDHDEDDHDEDEPFYEPDEPPAPVDASSELPVAEDPLESTDSDGDPPEGAPTPGGDGDALLAA